MATRQVYVIWAQPLFHDTLRKLLNHTDIDWVGAASDFAIAVEEISSLKPNTILVEEREGETISSTFMKILEKVHRDLRVVGVSFNDNQLNIYQHEHQTVGQPEDLIRMILQ
jgi:DNA-binding NarL/FixJ family response regulator